LAAIVETLSGREIMISRKPNNRNLHAFPKVMNFSSIPNCRLRCQYKVSPAIKFTFDVSPNRPLRLTNDVALLLTFGTGLGFDAVSITPLLLNDGMPVPLLH
jgi:hypothetical protein